MKAKLLKIFLDTIDDDAEVKIIKSIYPFESNIKGVIEVDGVGCLSEDLTTDELHHEYYFNEFGIELDKI